MARTAASQRGKAAATTAATDPAEQAAIARATAVLKDLAPTLGNHEAVAYAVVSAWIVERAKQRTNGRMATNAVLSLGDSARRGLIEGALPSIAGRLGHIPADVPFFALPKEQVVDALAAGIEGYAEAAVAAGERPEWPFDDQIPF